MAMTPFILLQLLLCLVILQLVIAFKSSSIQQSVGSSINSNSNKYNNGGAYTTTTTRRRPHKRNAVKSILSVTSRLPITIYQESACTVRLALGDDNDSESSQSSATTPTISDKIERRFSAASTEKSEILVEGSKNNDNNEEVVVNNPKAVTSSVNDRLLSEIQASVEKEKYGTSSGGRQRREYFKDFQSQKTEEERQRSIEEARDLNGVNPLVCIGGAAFAWACAGGLWLLTTYLGVLFASHPLDTDVYFVQRLSQVFRNVIMGLSSLASGFFGVIGIGIFLLGLRVAYGVMTGELDPTPIKQNKSEEIQLPDVWGLMMGKSNKRGRR